MFPYKETITAVQAEELTANLMDLVIEKLRESELISEPTRYVFKHDGNKIAEALLVQISLRVNARMHAIKPQILERQDFDPVKFLGEDWSIEEQGGNRIDNNLDAKKIIIKNYLEKDEPDIDGKECLKRIKVTPKDIQLDASDFLALWQEEGHLTLEGLCYTKGITFLSFWGTILRDPDGEHSVLCLRRESDGSWNWCEGWLEDDWCTDCPAGILTSN